MENTETTTNQMNEQPINTLHQDVVSIDAKRIVEWVFYVIGIVLVIFSLVYFFKDLDLCSSGDIYEFKEKSYVGGDAYNFIISAARSGAVMTKSLVLAVLGCSSIIVGRLTAILNKMK